MKKADITKQTPGALIQTESATDTYVSPGVENPRNAFKKPRKDYEKALLLQQENRILKEEFKSFKRQIDRRRNEMADQTRRELFLDLLPVMDDLLVMMKHYSGRSEDQQLKEGAELIYKNFENRLANRFGVEQVKTSLPKQHSVPEVVIDETIVLTNSTEEMPPQTHVKIIQDESLRSEAMKNSTSPQGENTASPASEKTSTPPSRPATNPATSQQMNSSEQRRSRPVIPRLDDQNSAPLMRDSLVRPPIADGNKAEVIIVPDNEDSSADILRPDYDRYAGTNSNPMVKVAIG
ncbi:MAG: nucleotide exchange factor GrpE, partial [Calditrichota bacterium]